MPDLLFSVESVKAMADSATPILVFSLRIENANKVEEVGSVSLNCQLHIHPSRRRYQVGEERALGDLFGERERWGTTLRPLFWTSVPVMVPGFHGVSRVDVRVPCTFDFNIAATKYCNALEQGDVPISWAFSGIIFYFSGEMLQMAPVSWASEAEYRIPAAVWKEMMALYYPNSAWLTLRKDIFERFYLYKVRHGLPTWEQTVEHVLAAAGEGEQGRTQ